MLKIVEFIKPKKNMLLAVVLTVCIIFSAIFVGVSANNVNILEGNTTGKLYNITLNPALTQASTFVDNLVYNNLAPSAMSGDFAFYLEDKDDYNNNSNTTEFLTAQTLGKSNNDDIIKSLTYNTNIDIVKIEHTSGGAKPLSHRAALAFDLGAYYDVDKLDLTQVISKENMAILNFSVYVGEKLTPSIFQNEVGKGGSKTDEKLSVNLENSEKTRYIVIVFDHVSATYNTIVNQYSYHIWLKSIEAFGTKTGDLPPQVDYTDNILDKENAIGGLYNIALPQGTLTQGQAFNATALSEVYDNLEECDVNGGFILLTTDTADVDGDGNTTEYLSAKELGKSNAEILEILTNKDNTQIVNISHDPKDSSRIKNRFAIVYDLGAFYNIDRLDLTQGSKDYVVTYNFSVYAGNTLDGTIFDNLVGRGGCSTYAANTMSATLENAENCRYLVVVVDHASQSFNNFANEHGYFGNFTNIAAYGLKQSDLSADAYGESILGGNENGTLYNITLNPALTQGAAFVDNLVYNNLSACAMSRDFALYTEDKTDLDNDGNITEFLTAETLGKNNADILKSLTDTSNNDLVKIEHTSGGANPLSHRAAIVYDLGAYYDVNKLEITQAISKENMAIINYSVYAGKTLDENIFKNRVGKGGSTTDDVMSTVLSDYENTRYIVIVFDHVSKVSNSVINQYAYHVWLKNIVAFGTKTGDLEAPVDYGSNIIVGNENGALYNITLNPALTQGAAFADDLVYNNLEKCARSADFALYLEDKDDADSDGNITEFLTADTLGKNNADILKSLTDTSNNDLVKIEHTSGGANPLSHRAAIVYDLGAYYDVNKVDITQAIGKENMAIINFSVYAGKTIDETIFQNKVGKGGSRTEDTMSAVLDDLEDTRYIVIVFDHVSQSSNPIINQYAYHVWLKNIAVFGTLVGELEPPVDYGSNILVDNKNGVLYNITLNPALTQGAAFVDNLVYDNLEMSAMSGDFALHLEDKGDADNDGNVTEFLSAEILKKKNADILNSLTKTDNEDLVKIEHTSGGATPLSHRAAIVYDLGAYYDVNKVDITQVISQQNMAIINFSVYAGKTLDASILENCVGKGGSKTDDVISAVLTDLENTRYIVIVFDHVSQPSNPIINQYTYHVWLKNIAVLGTKVSDLEPEPDYGKNILVGNKNGAIYKIGLNNPLIQGENFADDLIYDNLTKSGDSANFAILYTDVTDADKDGQTNDTITAQKLGKNPADILKSLTYPDNNEVIRIEHTSGGDAPLSNRAAIVYDLGAYYDVNKLDLTQFTESKISIYKFSVYASSTLDSDVFANCVGRGGSKTQDEMSVVLTGAKNVRYLLITFDHVGTTNNPVINKYSYRIWLKNIAAFGVKTGDLGSGNAKYGKNILLNNTSGRIYQVSGAVKNDIVYVPDYKTLKYTSLYDGSSRYGRFGCDWDLDNAPVPNATDDPSLKYLTDGNLDEIVKIQYGGSSNNGFIEKKRAAILYDLGGWYDLTAVNLVQDASSNLVRNYSVYAGAFGDSRILDNLVGYGGGVFDSITAELTNATSVRYVLIVFDNVTASNSVKTNYYAYIIKLLQVECFGKVNKNPTIPFDIKANDILEKNDKLTATMVFIDHEFGWPDSFEKGSFNYETKDFHIQSELDKQLYAKWIDGDSKTTSYYSSGITSKNNLMYRKAVLFDLGDFYNLSELELEVPAFDGRYIYDYSVYAGMVPDSSILNNLVGHGGSEEPLLSSKLNYNKSVRYVLVTFNKLGTDPGNLNDDGTRSLASQVDRTGALPGCTWADGGIHIYEISLYGTKGVDTTETLTYTDEESGVEVKVVTYDNPVSIKKIAVLRNKINDIHKGILSLEALYPMGDAYRVEFYDEDGNIVTDMKGRQFTVSFPMEYGDEVVYKFNDDGSIEKMNLAINMDAAMLVYASSPDEIVYDFIVASYTEPSEDNKKPQIDVKNDSVFSDVGIIIAFISSAVIIAAALTLMFVVLKRRGYIK